MLYVTVFFFKQKTAYEMSASLVGSEMCIRDRTTRVSESIKVQIPDMGIGGICNRSSGLYPGVRPDKDQTESFYDCGGGRQPP